MNTAFDYEPGLEPERYELDEHARFHFAFDRRDFFKTVGAGIVVACLIPREADAQQRKGFGGGAAPSELGAWLHIGEDGLVTAFTGKVEVGQNIRTSLSQVVAEELRLPLASVRLVMSDTQLCPFDSGTAGSRTTPDMAPRLRRAAAAAREVLVDLAAAEWKLDRAALKVAGGKVIHEASGRSLDFGKLTKGQKLTRAVADSAPTTAAADWKIAGHTAKKVNGRDHVTGRHKFASDTALPGLLHGKVLRPPSFNAELISADTTAAGALPGVVVVRDGNFIGIAAPTQFEAERALKAIKAEWKTTPQISSKELFAQLKQPGGGGGGGGKGGGGGGNRAGSIADGLAAADFKLEHTFNIAYIAHAPLEPRTATAQWQDGKLTVWTGTQRPWGVRSDLVNTFRLTDADVRVIVPDTGSGYGGKHTVDTAVEAARLAKAAGKPVKVTWTREEEFTWAYFRPAGVIEVKAGARKDGTLSAWEFHNYNSGGSGIRLGYEAPNQLVEFHGSRAPLRQGSYRALASTANTFARETAMDELAHAAKMDPLEFRLKNLKDPRLRAVFEAAAKAFGWGAKKPAPGHGFGIGGGTEKASFVATCAEVAVDKTTGRVRVVRAVSAFECGAILNPDQLRNQVEGCMIMGLGGALFEAIEFADGKILNPHFADYRVPRFSDTPEIEIVLLDRKDLPSVGAGETPIIGIAPAIGNAIFAATGVRLRSLPMAPNGVRMA